MLMSIQLFTNDWIEKSWIYTFPEPTSIIYNANNFVEDLNKVYHVHILRH